MESPGGQSVGPACPDGLGDTIFSAAIQFPANEILAIANRGELTAFEGFSEADLASEKVAPRMFHCQPGGAATLASFVSARRSENRNHS
jgi:hypothetical protein